MAFATPTELKPQFILPLSYESGRFRLQAQLKEARRHIVSWPNTQIWEFGQALLPVRTWGGGRKCSAVKKVKSATYLSGVRPRAPSLARR